MKTFIDKNLNQNLIKALGQIANQMNTELENQIGHIPFGSCYLIGHCLASGLNEIGLNAKETTGELILKYKPNKNVIYGNSKKYKGIIVGYYHTWCVLEYEGKKIVIDPSMKYNKMALKERFNISVDNNIPDVVISSEAKNWLFSYIEDSSLVPQSKEFLNKVDPKLITYLSDNISETASVLKKSNLLL